MVLLVSLVLKNVVTTLLSLVLKNKMVLLPLLLLLYMVLLPLMMLLMAGTPTTGTTNGTPTDTTRIIGTDEELEHTPVSKVAT